jgi:hypothetical protein
VTFLFTDIEGSTGLWESAPDAMSTALARHDMIVRDAIEAHGGYVFATGGDGFAAAFGSAPDAIAAAESAQAALSREAWPEGAVLAVRMGLHTGVVEERNGDYFGPAVNRAARIMAAGHGGQALVSTATAALACGMTLADLGEHSFAGRDAPQRVYQLGEGSFAPLRSVSAVPSNLPAERSVFVGRERELAMVAGLVRSARLVTLTGVGKVPEVIAAGRGPTRSYQVSPMRPAASAPTANRSVTSRSDQPAARSSGGKGGDSSGRVTTAAVHAVRRRDRPVSGHQRVPIPSGRGPLEGEVMATTGELRRIVEQQRHTREIARTGATPTG